MTNTDKAWEEMVEAGAKSLAQDDGIGDFEWSARLSENQRESYRDRANAALQAAGVKELVEERDSLLSQVGVMREALEKIRRGPAKPAPDPVAHSWEAFARHMNGFAVDARMAAADALSTLPTVGAEDGTLTRLDAIHILDVATEEFYDEEEARRAVEALLPTAQAPSPVQRVEELEDGVRSAALRFREYEQNHLAKGTGDGDAKAARNREMAVMLEALLDSKEGK